MNRSARRYLSASVALLIFALIYEYFSYGVYSAFMLGAFLIPLLGGFLPALLLKRLPPRLRPGELGRFLWDAGIATLSAGSLFRGVLEIYGTTSRLGRVYWFVGAAFCLAALSAYVCTLLNAPRADAGEL